MIGVTGSVGKTTAKEMTAAVLSKKHTVLKTRKNLNNEIGVPLMLLSLRAEHEAAVIEMGISEFGEMSRLSKMVRPDICLMTAIGYCHLENLNDLNGVLKAKSEVFQYMAPDSVAVVCGDDKLLRTFNPGIRKITYGFEQGTTIRPKMWRTTVRTAFPSISCTRPDALAATSGVRAPSCACGAGGRGHRAPSRPDR